MKRALSEIQESLHAQRRGRGRDARYVVTCPLCGHNHSVDVRSSDSVAQVAAEHAIVQHLRKAHADEIEANA